MEEERRQGMEEMKIDIALIKQKATFIDNNLADLAADFRDFKKDLDLNTIVTKQSFDSHVIQDRWLFGIIITLLVVVLGKLICG